MIPMPLGVSQEALSVRESHLDLIILAALKIPMWFQRVLGGVPITAVPMEYVNKVLAPVPRDGKETIVPL